MTAGQGKELPQVILALPAFNEEAAIGTLIGSAHEILSKASLGHRFVAVDDGSRDRTFAILRDLSSRLPIVIEHHRVNMNLGPTIRDALRIAAEHAATDDAIVTMDADGTHPVALMPRMVELLQRGNDVVIASRFQPGSKIIGVPWYRQVLTAGAGLLFRGMFPIRGVRDYTSGFRAYRAAVIKRAFETFGEGFVDQTGFQCMVDILLKLSRLRVSFVEVPMTLHYDKKEGGSKMKVAKTVYATVRLLLRRRFGRYVGGSTDETCQTGVCQINHL